MKRKYIFILSAVAALAITGLALQSSVGYASAEASVDDQPAMCDIHGISVDLCTRCNPDLISDFKARGDWCAGHNLPESQCDLCAGGHDQEHERATHTDEPEHEILRRQSEYLSHHDDHEEPESASDISVFFPENVSHCATDEAVIQLASIKTAERTGLSIRQAVAVASSPVIEAPAEITFNETTTMVLSTTIPALVARWLVEPGQSVKKGDLLARLHAPALPEMKAEYLEAHASWVLATKRLNRQKELHRKNLISDSELETDETEYHVAEAHLTGRAGMLKSAGLSEADLEAIVSGREINQTLHVSSPEDGIVIDRIAVLGELLDAGQPLAIIGNPDSLWIEARVRENDAPDIVVGDMMEFTSDGVGLQRCTGEIIWISRFLDQETRTATVRAAVRTASGRIQAGQYGRATIAGDHSDRMVIVPRDAVQWEGCCNVVFVKETIDRFRPRKVNIAAASNGHYRVTDGLSAGEEIVVDGSYLLKTELKKGAIGAGCAGH